MRRATLVGAIFCTVLLLSISASAREGVVKLNDGRSLTGDVVEEDGNITVTIRGIRTVFARADVASIDYGADAEKEFNNRLAKLEKNDAKGRVELGRWAFDQEEYELARLALDEARNIDPNNTEAATLLATVQSQMRLQRSKAAGATRPAEGTTNPAAAMTRPAGTDVVATRAATTLPTRPTLSAEDINIIRQQELQPEDNQVRLQFSNDVRKRFATQENMTVQQFNALMPHAQALRILERGDAAMKRDVRVVSDPHSLFEFRRMVQPAILANCATSGCHGGGTGVGGLWLLNPADNDASVYTNFYLLQGYRKTRPGGNAVFGGGDLRLIDRTHPDDSLLLNYALPSSVAQFDHPQVQGWKPVFRNRQDQGYLRMADWIRASLKPMDPVEANYGINFQGNGATTQPTTGSTTVPATAPTTSAPAE